MPLGLCAQGPGVGLRRLHLSRRREEGRGRGHCRGSQEQLGDGRGCCRYRGLPRLLRKDAGYSTGQRRNRHRKSEGSRALPPADEIVSGYFSQRRTRPSDSRPHWGDAGGRWRSHHRRRQTRWRGWSLGRQQRPGWPHRSVRSRRDEMRLTQCSHRPGPLPPVAALFERLAGCRAICWTPHCALPRDLFECQSFRPRTKSADGHHHDQHRRGDE
jgi:hypothetical protein